MKLTEQQIIEALNDPDFSELMIEPIFLKSFITILNAIFTKCQEATYQEEETSNDKAKGI